MECRGWGSISIWSSPLDRQGLLTLAGTSADSFSGEITWKTSFSKKKSCHINNKAQLSWEQQVHIHTTATACRLCGTVRCIKESIIFVNFVGCKSLTFTQMLPCVHWNFRTSHSNFISCCYLDPPPPPDLPGLGIQKTDYLKNECLLGEKNLRCLSMDKIHAFQWKS